MSGYVKAATVKLAWEAAPIGDPRTAVIVKRQASCTGPFIALASIPTPGTTFNDTTVALNNAYCWYATEKYPDGSEGGPSNTVRATCKKVKNRIVCS